MATSSSSRKLLAVSAVVAGATGLWLLRGGSTEERGRAEPALEEKTSAPATRQRAAPEQHTRPEEDEEEPTPDDVVEAPRRPKPRHTGAASPPQPGRRGAFLDAADPCEPLVVPGIPASYQRLTEADITVAWPPGLAVHEPTSLAFAVAGLLREAANATGTDAREQLTVFLYPSSEELHLATGTPEWASGVYDGAVHVVSDPSVDFGVRLATLRHEVMHAQLHSGVGCMPAWFNEGAAQHFAGRPPVTTWIAMLRERTAFDFDALSVPTITEAPKDDAPLLYAQSLAMLLFVIDRSGSEGSLREVVQALHEIDRPDPQLRARTLWKTLSPSTTASDVRTSLARRIFGPVPELEMETMFAGPACCTGERRLSELTCRPAGDEPGATGADAGSAGTQRCRIY